MGFAADGIYSSGADQEDNCHNPFASFSPYQRFISNLSMPSPGAVGDNSGILATWNMFMEENIFPSDTLSFSVSDLPYTQALQDTIRSGRYHSSITLLYFQRAFITQQG